MLSQASRFASVGALVVLCGAFLTPGCSSGGDDDEGRPTPGSGNGGGGTNAGTGNGGTSGSSAGEDAGGAAGSDGSSQTVSACAGVTPTSSIADFNVPPSAGAEYQWGSAAQGDMDFWGGAFNYPAALELSFADGAMTAAGNVSEYAGFGLYVQNCADASSFEGVRFKIKGTPPMGKMSFAVQTNKNEWATGVKGACLAAEDKKFIDCSHPFVPITVTEEFTTVEVTWAELGGGKPAPDAKTDGSDVIGLQFILPWTEKATPYEASVTIDDVELIGEGGGFAGAGGQAGMAGAGGAG